MTRPRRVLFRNPPLTQPWPRCPPHTGLLCACSFRILRETPPTAARRHLKMGLVNCPLLPGRKWTTCGFMQEGTKLCLFPSYTSCTHPHTCVVHTYSTQVHARFMYALDSRGGLSMRWEKNESDHSHVGSWGVRPRHPPCLSTHQFLYHPYHPSTPLPLPHDM